MIGYWISFGLIAVLIPIGLVELKRYALKGKNVTKEQEKHANAMVFRYWIFYWLCDLFYMSCFIQNLVCQFVFGGLILCIIFMNLGLVFSFPKEKSSFERWGMLQDFLVGIGITVYLLYIVPNADLKDVLIPVVSAVYGGLLTLAGVAWTIRQTQADKKKDDIARAKPYFSFNVMLTEPKGGSFQKTCFPMIENESNRKCEAYVEIENSNQSVTIFQSVYHDGAWNDIEMNKTLVGGGKCILSFCFDSPFEIYLKVTDIYGNAYFYRVKVLAYPNPLATQITSSGRAFHTIRDIAEVTQEEMDKEIKEAKGHGSSKTDK